MKATKALLLPPDVTLITSQRVPFPNMILGVWASTHTFGKDTSIKLVKPTLLMDSISLISPNKQKLDQRYKNDLPIMDADGAPKARRLTSTLLAHVQH